MYFTYLNLIYLQIKTVSQQSAVGYNYSFIQLRVKSKQNKANIAHVSFSILHYAFYKFYLQRFIGSTYK